MFWDKIHARTAILSNTVQWEVESYSINENMKK